jgi:predicted heme/steroid binding protein
MKTNKTILLVLLAALLLIAGCAKPTATPAPTAEEAASAEQVFTVEELAKFNGKDGAKAYIAVDGIVYDVTEISNWKNGSHNGFEAGKILSDEIKNKSPHGVSKLEGLPIVGKMAE